MAGFLLTNDSLEISIHMTDINTNTIPVGDLTIKDLTMLAQVRNVADQEVSYLESLSISAKERYDMDLTNSYKDYIKCKDNPFWRAWGMDKEDLIYGSKIFNLIILGFNKLTGQTFSSAAGSFVCDTEQEVKQFLKTERPLLYCIYKQPPIPAWNPKTFEPDPSADPIPARFIVRRHIKIGKLSWFKYHLQFILPKLPLNEYWFKYFYRMYLG
jgi:hypothetical protein